MEKRDLTHEDIHDKKKCRMEYGRQQYDVKKHNIEVGKRRTTQVRKVYPVEHLMSYFNLELLTIFYNET